MSEKPFNFTVRQLIEALASLPPDLPVLVSGYENGFEHVQTPAVARLQHQPDNPYWEGEFQPAEEYGDDSIAAVVLQRVLRDD